MHAVRIVLAAALLAGCEQELPDVDCAPPVPAFAEVHAFRLSCTTCHSSTLQGPARFGAPPGVDFDTHASAMAHAEHAVRRVFAGEMPPTGRLADADKQDLYRWSLCGTPP